MGKAIGLIGNGVLRNFDLVDDKYFFRRNFKLSLTTGVYDNEARRRRERT